MNPTHDVLEKRIAALEGGAAAVVLSSGTTAIHYSLINVAAVTPHTTHSPFLLRFPFVYLT